MKSRRLGAVAGVIAVMLATACSAPPVQQEPDLSAMERRIVELERRIRRLEQRPPQAASTYPAASPQTPSEEEAVSAEHLESLREQRRLLLKKYTSRHPDAIFLDREIHRPESQLPNYDPPLPDITAETPAT